MHDKFNRNSSVGVLQTISKPKLEYVGKGK
jgi:hypothetical protein